MFESHKKMHVNVPNIATQLPEQLNVHRRTETLGLCIFLHGTLGFLDYLLFYIFRVYKCMNAI